MFCPRCGRNLNGDEFVCPECGNVLKEPPTTYSAPRDTSSDSTVWVYFILGMAIMFFLTYFVGFYFLFFFIPVFVTGTKKRRSTMLFTGAMLGTLVAIVFKMFL